MKKPISVKQFQKDLTAFISSHPYLTEQNTTAEVTMPLDDSLRINIHTVDGDYERIVIKVIPIS